MMLLWREARTAALRAFAFICLSSFLLAQSNQKVAEKFDTRENASHKILSIPKLERAPTLEDFAGMEPGDFAHKMAHADTFIQADPKDGEPATEKTEAFFGYDNKNLYGVFLAFDDHPELIRGRMSRRENAGDDDWVELTLDTFKDKRRGFVFSSNPLGVQTDGLWAEGNGPDWSWDTVWKTDAKRTDKGFMIMMTIPFRSLRFSPAQLQDWGIVVLRVVQRKNEWSYWPHISSKINGRLNQAGTLRGMEGISPGRNLQFIPYGIMRTYRALDERGTVPTFAGQTIAGDIGLDAKVVLKDRFVFDFTANPDFSQVESDSPQVTVNQRFEVFFPEKRPFFLENASFFRTPIDLAFTRRIADPDYGVRMTGKQGPYAIGVMFADDSAPGKRVPYGDPLDKKKAYFGIARVNRDIGKESTLGLIYAHRQFQGENNMVGGIDGNFRWKKNWYANFQAVNSNTTFLDGTHKAGPAYTGFFGYGSRNYEINTAYNDNGEGFYNATGFFRRPGIRRTSTFANYRWRPKKSFVQSFGPNFWIMHLFDRNGLMLENDVNPSFDINMARNSWLSFFADIDKERLRPRDFSGLAGNTTYNRNDVGIGWGTSYFKQVTLNGNYWFGRAINYVTASGTPTAASVRNGNMTLRIKPIDKMQIENSYLYQRLGSLTTREAIYNSHTIRSKVNYQFNKELSLRLIGQYTALLTNPNNTFLQSDKGLNGDILVTYLLNPGTAIHVGYNTNVTNLDPRLVTTTDGYLRTRDGFINDGRQFFIKISYLFRY